MVYIIGVDHLVQYRGPVPEELREEFKHYLSGLVKDLNITLIAEEFSYESLYHVYGSSECTALQIAWEYGIDHMFCDPEEKERESLGIPYYYDIKETVAKRYNISSKVQSNNELRKKIENEAGEIARSYWDIREKFWVKRIADRIEEQIIFICGHEHAERLNNLLKSLGCGSQIVDHFWHSEIFSNYGNIGLA